MAETRTGDGSSVQRQASPHCVCSQRSRVRLPAVSVATAGDNGGAGSGLDVGFDVGPDARFNARSDARIKSSGRKQVRSRSSCSGAVSNHAIGMV